MNPNARSAPHLLDATVTSVSGGGPSRRQWLKGVGAASPVLLTIASSPVRANDACINASAYVSAITYASRHPGGVPPPCSGLGPNSFLGQTTPGLSSTQNSAESGSNGKSLSAGTPSYNSAYWPTSSPNTQTTHFKAASLFGNTNTNGYESGVILSTWKLRDVLNSTVVTPFTKYCIAAYLNARCGTPEFPLTAAQALVVWKHFRAHANTTLIPAGWTEDDAMNWLQILMP